MPVLLSLLACQPSVTSPPSKTEHLSGIALKLALWKGSPLGDALKLQVAEFEARTGATVSVEETDDPNAQADVRILPGTALYRIENPLAFSAATLQTPTLEFESLPQLYRDVFCRRAGKTIALPIGADQLLLWYREDLFRNPALVAAYRKETAAELAPPGTWAEFDQIARFFEKQKAVEVGCLAASDGSAESVRNLLAHCAGLAKAPGRSSFTVNTETGESLIASEPFGRGLTDRKNALPPQKIGLDDQAARRTFRAGKSAMLLSALAPTVDAESKSPHEFDDKIAVAPLPGSDTLFDPRTGQSQKLEAPNRCVHLASTGWFVTLGTPSNQVAAEQLAGFLATGRENDYLVQACRRGLIPVHANLLSQAGRFRGYGLSDKTVAKWFELIAAGFSTANWVADDRTSAAPALTEALAGAERSALEGKATPRNAMSAANDRWKTIIEPRKKQHLAELRDSLGLPAIAQ